MRCDAESYLELPRAVHEVQLLILSVLISHQSDYQEAKRLHILQQLGV